MDDNGSDDDLPPPNLNINPELSADERAAIVRASAGMNDVFSATPRPYARSDAASHYQVLPILPRASGTGHAGQHREESHGLYHARASSQPGNNGEASSSNDHAGQGREESHELNHARASSHPVNNGEALPAASSSEAYRPLRTTDAAAQYHALLILNPPDLEESDDSELTPEELIEAIIESTCMSCLDD